MSEEVIVGTGVKFRIKDVPVMAFRDLQKRLERERPRPPVSYIEEKEREEVNENDPDYVEALKAWNESTEMKLMDFVLMSGTEALEIPDSVKGLTDESWADECRYLGMEVPQNGGVRYLCWLKYVACPTPKDISDLVLGAGRKLGVTEADVADAAEMFQSRTERPADSGTPSKTRRK